jgi:hypothetical protein
VTYDEFKQSWIWALQQSALPIIGGGSVDETLDLRMMDRVVKSAVEPLGRDDSPPFHISAILEYRWDALQHARTATTEEDLLTELLGRENVEKVRTERPWLRVDVTLRASLESGKAIPMPSPSAWRKWAREAIGRLERIEPVVPSETTREGRGGRMEILAWQGEPEARVLVAPDGTLKLDGIELASWQAIELPRKWDDPDRKVDDGPEKQLVAMFSRVKAAIHAWLEVLDHLRPASS